MVQAGRAREAGFDRSMIFAYGQDDRVCAFTSLKAMLDTEKTLRTKCCILVDKEEIGSVGATGMQSHFFENMVAEVMNLCGEYSELNVRRCLSHCCMLSSDVSSAFDPSYAAKNIHFQTAAPGRVDAGGGGTIAYILALYGMNVIDSGVAVLNMHAPWEATSKADVYEAYRGYKAFVEGAEL